MRQDWIDSGDTLIDFHIARVDDKYRVTPIAIVGYPSHLDPTPESVRKDLLACGFYNDIEVVRLTD